MNRVRVAWRFSMTRKAFALGFVALLLAACGPAKPLVHDIPQPDEIPPGPGLFSGKDGKFILFGNSEDD